MTCQNERLLTYLEQHKQIDPLTAWADLGIYRLGARIFDLAERGHKIERDWLTVTNRFGEECRVRQYRLGA